MAPTRVAGIIATAFGVLFLFYMFVGSTLQPPGLTGAAWWVSVLRTMVSRGAIAGTVLGVVCVVGGVFLLFFGARRRPAFIAVIVMAALAVLVILGIAMS